MTISILLSECGDRREIDAGESADVTATFYDFSGVVLDKASIVTLTATLKHVSSAGVATTINSRDNQDVLDINGGTVSAAGVLTLKLQPLDNVLVEAAYGGVESHYLLLEWTWVDTEAVTRTGTQEWEFFISQHKAFR